MQPEDQRQQAIALGMYLIALPCLLETWFAHRAGTDDH
jgi:hypothetical protein